MITEEWAKNPKAEVKVRCDSCKKQFPIEEMLKEEAVPVHYHPDATEAFWLCPSCGFRKHSFYLTNELRAYQERLRAGLAIYNRTHSSTDFEKHRKTQRGYQVAFDNVQLMMAQKLKEKV